MMKKEKQCRWNLDKTHRVLKKEFITQIDTLLQMVTDIDLKMRCMITT